MGWKGAHRRTTVDVPSEDDVEYEVYLRLFIYMYVSLFTCLYVCLWFHVHRRLSARLRIKSALNFDSMPIGQHDGGSACLSVRPSVRVFACLSLCLFPICMSVYIYVDLIAHLSVCLSTCLCIYPPVCVSIHLSVFLSTCLCVCPPIRVSIHLYV